MKRKIYDLYVNSDLVTLIELGANKAPITEGWQRIESGDHAPYREEAIYGCRCDRVVVIDVDRKGADSLEESEGYRSFLKLCKDYDLDAEELESVAVLTQGGGLHVYCLLDGDMNKLKKGAAKSTGYPGIDIKAGTGHQVVCGGQTMPNGKEYVIQDDSFLDDWNMPVLKLAEGSPLYKDVSSEAGAVSESEFAEAFDYAAYANGMTLEKLEQIDYWLNRGGMKLSEDEWKNVVTRVHKKLAHVLDRDKVRELWQQVTVRYYEDKSDPNLRADLQVWSRGDLDDLRTGDEATPASLVYLAAKVYGAYVYSKLVGAWKAAGEEPLSTAKAKAVLGELKPAPFEAIGDKIVEAMIEGAKEYAGDEFVAFSKLTSYTHGAAKLYKSSIPLYPFDLAEKKAEREELEKAIEKEAASEDIEVAETIEDAKKLGIKIIGKTFPYAVTKLPGKGYIIVDLYGDEPSDKNSRINMREIGISEFMETPQGQLVQAKWDELIMQTDAGKKKVALGMNTIKRAEQLYEIAHGWGFMLTLDTKSFDPKLEWSFKCKTNAGEVVTSADIEKGRVKQIEGDVVGIEYNFARPHLRARPAKEVSAEAAALFAEIEKVYGVLYGDTEARVLFDWIAKVAQDRWNYGCKKSIFWSPVLLSETNGTGKTALYQILKRTFKYEVSAFNSTVTGRQFQNINRPDKMISFMDEAHLERREFNDEVKPFVANKTVVIERKGVDQDEEENFTHILMASNHVNDISLDMLNDDRRYYFITFKHEGMEDLAVDVSGLGRVGFRDTIAYFVDKFSEDENIGKMFYRWLIERDTSALPVTIRPIEGNAVTQLLEARNNLSEIVQFAEALIDWDGTNMLEPEYREKVEKFESETGIGIVPEMFTEDMFFYTLLCRIEGVKRSEVLASYLHSRRMVSAKANSSDKIFKVTLSKYSGRQAISIYAKRTMLDENGVMKPEHKEKLSVISEKARNKLTPNF